MADLFQNRIVSAHTNLAAKYGDRIDVPPERHFVGFDAYRKAIDCLRPGDVAMLTGYSGFRPGAAGICRRERRQCLHGEIVCARSAGLRRMIKAGEAAEKKNLKIAAGLMCRHCATART